MLIFHESNKRMIELSEQIKKVAKFNVPCLITGETGTGKTLIAEKIHNLSPRKNKPFISINCGGIPDSLLEAELFGYSKGAFTGAVNTRKGIIRSADKGTVFLDEIGTMPFSVQSKLLTFLDNKQIRPLGSEKIYDVDVRILTATNTNLRKALEERMFREDLYHRINVVNVETIPLRYNKIDLNLLCDFFLKEINKELGTNVRYIHPSVFKIFYSYNFVGNVRELKNILYNAIISHSESESDEITIKDLPKYLRKSQEELENFIDSFQKIKVDSSLTLQGIRSLFEPIYFKKIIDESNSIAEACKKSGISEPTLRKYIKKYNLKIPNYSEKSFKSVNESIDEILYDKKDEENQKLNSEENKEK